MREKSEAVTNCRGWCLLLCLFVVLALQAGGNAGARASQATSPVSMMNFDRVLLLEETSETSANVSIGDLDGDGNLDIVLVKGRHWPLLNLVLLNDGRGGFGTAQPLGAVADRSYSGLLVDIDRDGDLDVVISNDAPDPMLLYLNDGSGNFSVGSTFGRPEWPTRNASVADLNDDGLPDIIVANRTYDSSGSNYVCLNRGAGQFDADCIAFSRESATTITPADFNRDGHIDLAVPHRDGGQSYIYLNDGEAGFSNRVPFGPSNSAIRVVKAADLNGDELLDIVAIDVRSGASIYLNQHDGLFPVGVPLGNNNVIPYALGVSDLNGDSTIDVIVGNRQAPSIVYFNDGSATNFLPVQFGDDQGAAYGIAVGDIDQDGSQDIGVARSDAPNVLYFGAPAAREVP